MVEFWIFKRKSKKQLISQYILEPLNEAYTMIKQDKRMVYCDENTITQRLAWYLSRYTSLSHLFLKNAAHVVLRPKEQYSIDEVYEPDIKIMVRGIWMEIESKRIHEKNRWSISEYLSRKRGIGKFLWGVYSHNDHGGMIGYIQRGDFDTIVCKIKTGLLNMNCTKSVDMKIENCVLTIHYRSDKDDIKIYHLFFYFS